MRALDLYSRLGIGQYEEAINFLRFEFDPRLKDKDEEYEEAMQRLNEIKMLLFNMHPNASYGIHSREVPDQFRVAWDLMKVVRHQLWKDRKEEGAASDFTVDAYPPDQSVPTQPLAEIQRVE